MREMTGSEVVRFAIIDALERDEKTVLFGLGVEDPKGIFGTTLSLTEKFGLGRVFETPTAESASSGIAIGMALAGLKPTVTYQRVEFALLGFEQIVNQAAKWRYMTNGAASCPVTYRLIIGKGWGQGPQHSQGLESVFGHFPGLKVFAPGSPESLYHTIRSCMVDEDPCVILEHRWLHHVKVCRNVIESLRVSTKSPVSPAIKHTSGGLATVVSYGIGTMEALRALKSLREHAGVEAELVELTRMNPLDLTLVKESLTKTGRLIVFDHGWAQYGAGSEVIAKVALSDIELRDKPVHLHIVSVPIPSSRFLANDAYPQPADIARKLLVWASIDDENLIGQVLGEIGLNTDVPSESFKGPF
jgi:pyruvate dehydrogenase E1 component beta subunit